MAEKTIKVGALNGSKYNIANFTNPVPPFVGAGALIAGELIAVTDYADGDDVIFEVDASRRVVPIFTTQDGTILTYTEASLGAPRGGKKFTLAAVTATKVKFFIFQGVAP